MHRLTTFRLALISLPLGLAAACLLYKHAWRIPILQDLRDAQLFFALWMLATPLAAFLFALGRLAKWSSALLCSVICLGLATPAYGLTAGFRKAQLTSRDKAVLCNLRQLAAAADQYFLENGVTVVRFEDLVGPTKYIKALKHGAGEDYRPNFPFRQGGILSADFPNGRIINYNTGDKNPPGYQHVFAPGERPPWRTSPPASAPLRSGSTATPGSGLARVADAAPALSVDAFTRAHAQAGHKVRRGSMCASCHARKT